MKRAIRGWRGGVLAAMLALGSGTTAAAGDDAGGAAQLYLRVCSACHGEKGDGKSLASTALRTAPRDFTTEEARTGLSREYMIAILRDGRPHTAMVGRSTRLSQADMEGVVDFIRAAFMLPDPGSPLARARETYRNSCASCHGDRGQGGPARGAVPPSPALSASRARADLTAEAMVRAISREPHAPGMPMSGPGLSGEETGYLVAYIRATFVEAAAGRKGAGRPG